MENQRQNMYDAIVIGGGPAGLTAAIYLARAYYRVLVVEKEKFGGQISLTAEVVNYPGIEHISGAQLGEQMRRQADNFGAEFMLAEVKSLDVSGDIKKVVTSKGTFECFGIVLATGASPRMIGFEGEEAFKGHGVAYCATCDGEFFAGKEVFVVGGGFAAAEESVFLTKYATHVTVLVREDDFTCAKSVAQHTYENEKITVLTNTEVVKVEGDSLLRSITYKNNKTGEVTTYEAKENDTFGVFVFAGYVPATGIVKDLGILDERGYIVTDRSQKTALEGIYAAGDVCIKPLRQVVTTVGDAGLAATELEKHISFMEKKTGIKPQMPIRQSGAGKGGLQESPKAEAPKEEGGLFTADMLAQLNTVFGRMENPVVLKVYTDASDLSLELKNYMEELAKLTDKLSLQVEENAALAPMVEICRKDGAPSGLAFHGVPGGHEFTSFVLGIYNVAGPGQPLDEQDRARIAAIDKAVDMKIMVSLSCTMCPELVASAQRIAALNPHVSAHVYDINHFGDMRDRYQVMSVPCMVIGEGKPAFGKKNVEQILDLIGA